MNKILTVAISMAGLAVMSGPALAIYVSHDELKASCAKAGGIFEDRPSGYSCESKAGKTTIHISCGSNGNCVVYNNSVFSRGTAKLGNPSGNAVATLKSAGITLGRGKASAIGSV